jgi:hypothetical protein
VNVSDHASLDRMVARFADLMDLSESTKHIDRFLVPKPATEVASVVGQKRFAKEQEKPQPAHKVIVKEELQSDLKSSALLAAIELSPDECDTQFSLASDVCDIFDV